MAQQMEFLELLSKALSPLSPEESALLAHEADKIVAELNVKDRIDKAMKCLQEAVIILEEYDKKTSVTSTLIEALKPPTGEMKEKMKEAEEAIWGKRPVFAEDFSDPLSETNYELLRNKEK